MHALWQALMPPSAASAADGAQHCPNVNERARMVADSPPTVAREVQTSSNIVNPSYVRPGRIATLATFASDSPGPKSADHLPFAGK